MAENNTPPRVVRLLGEFFVIVIGVMVALAADSWMKSAEEAERVQAALTLLVEDLVTDSTRMEELVPYPPRHDSIRATLWSTPSDAAMAEDSVLVLFRRLLGGQDFQASRSTYESLVATDGIRFLDDAQLRADLMQYYEERQVDVVHWQGWYVQMWVALSEMIREYQTPAPADFEEGLRHWSQVPQRLTTSWREIRQDEVFMSQLWLAAIYEQALRQTVEAGLQANIELLAQVRVHTLR